MGIPSPIKCKIQLYKAIGADINITYWSFIMGTKQVQMYFSVAANPGETVNAIVFVDDVQKYAGPLANGSDVVTFDLDVINQQILTYIQPTDSGEWITPVAMAVTIENGSATLIPTKANYTGHIEYISDTSIIYVPGSSSDYQILRIASQPMWNGVADLNRYNFSITDPETGAIPIYSNETVTFQMSMTQWADE